MMKASFLRMELSFCADNQRVQRIRFAVFDTPAEINLHIYYEQYPLFFVSSGFALLI